MVVCHNGITVLEGTLMKKRLVALLLVLALLIPASIASAATWYRVNTSSLQVRQFPSESAKVLGSYRRDYVCTISSTKDGWSYVVFSNGFEGYVQKKHLSKASSYKAWITNDDTALRRGPDGSFGAIANLARGRKVTVLSHGSNYDYVNAGDMGTGYVINSRLSKKQVKASGTASTSTYVGGGNYDAWVMNAGDRKVNLRTSPSKNATVIAQYPTGTYAYVLSHSSTWDRVQINGNEGWMMTQYLSTSAPAPTPVPAVTPDPSGSTSYTAYVTSSNGKGVNLRRGPGNGHSALMKVPFGAQVTVLEHTSNWDKVQYNGKTGYMQNKFLQLTKPAGAPDITPTPVPAPAPAVPYTTTVGINDLNFHKKQGDWSSNVDGVGRLQLGDVVTVLQISGDWAKVEYNGYTGWVHKKYLN